MNGMYAFALYDLKLQKLFLSRDTTGQKPYITKDQTVFFLRIMGIKY